MRSIKKKLPPLLHNTDTSNTFTWISAVGLIGLIDAIKDAITAVGVGSTATFITLKGTVSTLAWWGNSIIFHTVPLIGLKFHAEWTAAHSTEGGGRETEMAAVTVGQIGRIAAAGEVFWEEYKDAIKSGFLDG